MPKWTYQERRKYQQKYDFIQKTGEFILAGYPFSIQKPVFGK